MAKIAPLLADTKYHDLFQHLYQFFSGFVLFFLIPALVVKYIFREDLANFGLRLGEWRYGLVFALIAFIVCLPFIYLGSLQADFQKEYPLSKMISANILLLIIFELVYLLLYYVSWEFFFRGFLLFGTRKGFGNFGAILLQTVASTLIHIGKPQGETMAAIVAGIVFGGIALRTKTVLPLILLHWLLGLTNDLFCILHSH